MRIGPIERRRNEQEYYVAASMNSSKAQAIQSPQPNAHFLVKHLLWLATCSQHIEDCIERKLIVHARSSPFRFSKFRRNCGFDLLLNPIGQAKLSRANRGVDTRTIRSYLDIQTFSTRCGTQN
jgi:hypothetical protein